MKKTHIWRSHVTVPRHDDLVLLRDPSESLDHTLARLKRLSIPTGPADLEVHEGV
jgi:hypothetical protein